MFLHNDKGNISHLHIGKHSLTNNPICTTWDIAEILYKSHINIVRHLKDLWYMNHYEFWMPHNLTEKMFNGLHFSAQTCKTNFFWKKNMITSNEKLIVYNNVVWKMSWTKLNQSPLAIAKDSLYQKEIMLGIWWYFKRIIYYELLPQKQTSNLDKYCSLLGWLKTAINEKHSEVTHWKMFHKDNARHLFSDLQKLLEFGWDILLV